MAELYAKFVNRYKLTLGGALIFRSEKRHDTFVDLDAGDDTALLQQRDQRCTVVRLLVQCLVEQDHSGDVFGEALWNKCVGYFWG